MAKKRRVIDWTKALDQQLALVTKEDRDFWTKPLTKDVKTPPASVSALGDDATQKAMLRILANQAMSRSTPKKVRLAIQEARMWYTGSKTAKVVKKGSVKDIITSAPLTPPPPPPPGDVAGAPLPPPPKGDKTDKIARKLVAGLGSGRGIIETGKGAAARHTKDVGPVIESITSPFTPEKVVRTTPFREPGPMNAKMPKAVKSILTSDFGHNASQPQGTMPKTPKVGNLGDLGKWLSTPISTSRSGEPSRPKTKPATKSKSKTKTKLDKNRRPFA